MHDQINHAVRMQELSALEPVRQGLAHGFLDHPGTGKTNLGTGFGNMHITQHGKTGADAAGGRIGEHHDIGQASLTHLLRGNDCARHLHQGQDTFLHPGTAGSRYDDQRCFLCHGQPCRRDDPFTNRNTHGPTHEGEVKSGNHGFDPVDAAMGNHDRIIATGLRLGIAQTVGIALAVTELERIGWCLRQLDQFIGTIVEHQFEALFRIQAHMVRAFRAHHIIGHQILVVDHGPTSLALLPQIIGDFPWSNQRANARTNIVGKPIHRTKNPSKPAP